MSFLCNGDIPFLKLLAKNGGWSRGRNAGATSSMIYRMLADVTFVAHLLFVIFVVFGGLLVLLWKRLAWLHVPALIWGVLLEWSAWICPLTPLENWLLERAGVAGYGEGFVAHYIVPIIYPDQLGREMQLVLGTLLLVFNILIYVWAFRHRRVGTNEQS